MSQSKVFSAVGWRGVQVFGQQGITFFTTLLLARLLTPEDFGICAIVNFFVVLALTFSAGGLGGALVYKKEIDELDKSTVFIFNTVVACLLFLILFLTAPLIAVFYKQKELIPIIRVVGIKIVIGSLSVVQLTLLMRDLKFKKISLINLVASGISGGFAVLMAWQECGVWSLVFQYLIMSTITTTLLWILAPWHPSLRFSWDRFLYLFRWGGGTMLAQLIGNAGRNCHGLIVGHSYGTADAGLINRAETLESLPRHNLTVVFSDIAGVLAFKQQDDNEQLRETVEKFLRFTLFIVMPLGIWLIICSREVIIFLLGEKWLPAQRLFRIFVVIGWFYVQNDFSNLVLKAKSQIRLLVVYEAIRRVCIILVAIVLSKIGTIGMMLCGELVLWCVFVLINTYFSKQAIDFGPLKQLKALWKDILLAGTLFPCLYYLHHFCQNLPIIVVLSITCLFTFIFWTGIGYLIKMQELSLLLNLIQEKLASLKNN